MPFDRLTSDPEVFGGRACVRGLRFPVSKLIGLVAAGYSIPAIIEEYPYIEAEDVHQALRYAAWLAQGELVESD